MSETATRAPSGDQTGAESIEPKVVVSWVGFAEPSCGTVKSCSSPVRSETKRIVFPSGDQAACLSCAFEERVRFRVGPLSIGAVKTSPRATKRARSPFGESANRSTFFSAEMRDGREARPSLGTVIGIARSAFAATSQSRSSPPSS